MKAKEIATFLKAEIIGDEDKEVVNVSHLDTAQPTDLTYCEFKTDEKDAKAILSTNAGIVICRKPKKVQHFKAALILSNQPRYDFARVITKFFYQRKRSISSSCYMGEDVKIGSNPDIHPGAVIHDGTVIGDRVTIRANAVLGGEGLTLGKSVNGEWKGISFLKPLIIGDDVEIGVGTLVQKGTLKPTVIGKGTKIGPNCNIAHQVKIGCHCAIPGLTLIGGHAVIGDYTYIGPQSTILNGVKIGKNCFVGIGSLVMNDVLDGQTVAGRPAIEIEEFRRQRKRLKELLK
ncbi:UDP-3-O-acylglucosamine N-acyltransferase [subsurface metagenome]